MRLFSRVSWSFFSVILQSIMGILYELRSAVGR